MTTKQEAKNKISSAADGCEAAQVAWRAAVAALDGSISVNGYGVHHDRHQLRYKLLDAQKHLQKALATLEGIDWLTNADYDLAE